MGVIERARELGMEFAATREYKNLRHTELLVDQDPAASGLTRQYGAAMERIQRLIAEDAGQEAVLQEQEQLRALHMAMETNPLIADYRAARADFDRLIGEVNAVIGHFLSGEYPGKQCGGCGGCGTLN